MSRLTFLCLSSEHWYSVYCCSAMEGAKYYIGGLFIDKSTWRSS